MAAGFCSCGERAVATFGTEVCVGHAILALARLNVDKRVRLPEELQQELIALRQGAAEVDERIAAAASEKNAALARAKAADERRKLLDVTVAEQVAVIEGQARQLATILGHPPGEPTREWPALMAEVSALVQEASSRQSRAQQQKTAGALDAIAEVGARAGTAAREFDDVGNFDGFLAKTGSSPHQYCAGCYEFESKSFVHGDVSCG